MDSSIGKRIMFHRKRLGLTQDQLAAKLGVTPQAVSKWENNQTCPDISMISKLSDLFGISTDELLGRQETVYQGEVVGAENAAGKWDFILTSGRKAGFGFAVLVILVGFLYLITALFKLPPNLWSILWPSALLVYGLFGLFPRFSFFRLGFTLLGLYYLLTSFFPQIFHIDHRIIFALLILLIGLSLFADTLQRSKKSHVQEHSPGKGSNSAKNQFQTGSRSFRYQASFGENSQLVALQTLEFGEISTSFGDYTVNLSGVEHLSSNAQLNARCEFGELTIIVPSRFSVNPDSHSSFASFKIEGEPAPNPEGILNLGVSVNFGQINVKYQ